MKNYFTFQEMCIVPTMDIPQDIATKLLRHILTMNPVREALEAPIWPSEKSGWRPYDYELKKDRSGKSQHTFLYSDGAVDWTCEKNKIKSLLQFIVEMTDYTRIAYYPNQNFIHCDYKPIKGNTQFYLSDGNSNWKPVSSF